MPLAIVLSLTGLLVFAVVFMSRLLSFKRRDIKKNRTQQARKPSMVVSYKNYCVIPATPTGQKTHFS